MAFQKFYQNTDACACLKKKKGGYVTCNTKPKKDAERQKFTLDARLVTRRPLVCTAKSRDTRAEKMQCCTEQTNKASHSISQWLCG